MNIAVQQVDYTNPTQAKALTEQLNHYARDPMGAGKPLPQEILDKLPGELAKQPNAFSLLILVDDEPAGFANCFFGFSTFKCAPLINIHDFGVSPNHRGLKLSQRLLQAIEDIAVKNGCVKITLEVLEGNKVAQGAYLKFGFSGYELDPTTGKALFWEKSLGTKIG